MPTSAQRKLLRGVEQIKTLCGETEAFVNDEAYVFEVKEARRSAQEVKYRCFARERKAPPDHWPLLAGEAIQNLRSALDHAVWSAWKAVPTNQGNGNHTQFPIALDPHGFSSQAGSYLQGVPQPIRAAIEAAQPYRRLPNAPAQDALEQLRTLSNLDKHRTLTAFAAAIYIESFSHWGDIAFAFEKYATNQVLGHGETEVSVFTVTSETVDVDVYPDFSYQVRIEGRPLDHFPVMARRVFECVGICESGGVTPPPFASYPI